MTPKTARGVVRNSEQSAAGHRGHRGGCADRARGGCEAGRRQYVRVAVFAAATGFGCRYRRVLHDEYLGGHSDVVGGALVAADADLGEQLAFHQNAIGSIAGPFDSWLVMRGVKTLAVRMDRHCENAARIAAFLQHHNAVSQVLYPGLPSHAGHEIAAKQMRELRWHGVISHGRRGAGRHRRL